MPNHYDDGEYRGSEHAADVFRAPPKEKTEGELLEESGEYIDSGEGTDNEGNLLQMAGEGALGVGKGALWGLEKYGQGLDWTNDQVNLRNLLRMNPANMLGSAITGQDPWGADRTPDWLDNILDYSYKDLRDHTAGGIGNVVGAVTGSETANDWAETAGQILLPDAVDFATGGVGYADNIARAATKLRKVDGKVAAALVEDIFSKSRLKAVAEGAKESVYEAARNVKDTVTAPIRTAQSILGGGMAQEVGTGFGPKTIKTQILEQRLQDPRITKFLTGEGKLRNKELANLVQDFSDRDDFMSVVSSRIDELKEKYPHLVNKLDNQKETISLRWHHVNPSKGPIDLYIGLTQKSDRDILRNYLVDELGVFSGNHPLNNRGLSIDVHDQIHDWLGETIGLRADVLKHKWAQKMGIDVGDLQPGTGFMSNHLTLSDAGKANFDAWFKTLSPQQRLPYIKEYGKIIKESEGVLSDLMKQYDALFAVPEGFHLHPDNDVLLRFLDEIPTDGTRLLQKDMRNIVEQVNREMPRGTIDIIDKTGNIKQLNLETDIYKRIEELKGLLDQKGLNRRTINSYTKELKGLEKGVLQKTLDIEGASKSGAWKKRLEQEKLRRKGK